LNLKKKTLFSILSMALVLVLISGAIISKMPATPPLINGILIQQAVELKRFSILDHKNRPYTNEQLLGKWQLLNYGYTSCPDVCPTVLSVLSRLDESLKHQEYSDLEILFYSIDHERDTTAHLAKYLKYFNTNFIGLTYVGKMKKSAEAFETSLGMIYKLTVVQSKGADNLTSENNTGDAINDFKSYSVSHGFMLYLINPEGKLQAVFKPQVDSNGLLYFDEQLLLKDYQAIREYLSQT
jgi:protein SCO1/2